MPSRAVRRRGRGQAEALESSVGRFGFAVPLIVSENGELIDGAGRLQAAKELGYEELPVAVVTDAGPAEIKALRLSLNKLAERGVWEDDALAAELQDILSADPLLATFTGFDMPEIDRRLAAAVRQISPEAEGTATSEAEAVSRVGDLWLIGSHRLLCGNAKDPVSYATVLADLPVQMVLSDVPYGIKIKGVVSRRHREFVEGSDLNEAELLAFFREMLAALGPSVPPGCVVDLFIDHRGLYALTTATREAGLEDLCLAAWDKTTGGMGGLYRHQLEYIKVMRRPGAANINNISLGRYGRNRTTLWTAPGFASFGSERKAALDRHPTCKPVGLLKEAILDVSHIGGVVLDMFAGSASTLVAAHEVQRVGVGIELDPIYVDVSVRRLQERVGEPARHAETGLTFDETAAQRRLELEAE